MTRKKSCQNYNRQLAICFAATMVLMGILLWVTWAFGQAHPFPFKTLEELTTGTAAWVNDTPPELRRCPPNHTVTWYRFVSGAGSIWVVYTDGTLFAAGYFPPESERPVTVVEGHIVDGQVVSDLNEPFNSEKHAPCNPWTRTTT